MHPRICRSCFHISRGIQSLQYQVEFHQEQKKQGALISSAIARNRNMEASSQVSLWLQSLLPLEEHMPHKNQVHISYPDKASAFEAFRQHCFSRSFPCPSQSIFNRVWRSSFPFIKCRTPNDFAVCKDCVNIEELLRAASAGEQKTELRRIQAAHRAFYQKERLAYKTVKKDSKEQPEKFLSKTIDGADQSCSSLLISTRDQIRVSHTKQSSRAPLFMARLPVLSWFL